MNENKNSDDSSFVPQRQDLNILDETSIIWIYHYELL